MADQAQDRNLPASSRKINKARGDGQVARSRELGHLTAFAVGGALLVAFGPELTLWLRALVENGLRFDARSLAAPDAMTLHLGAMSQRMLMLVLPMGVVMALAALVAGVAAGGWNFTLKPLQPSFGKLNPLSGLTRLVSKHQLGEMLKACALALVLFTIGTFYLRQHLPQFQELVQMELPTAMSASGTLLRNGLVLLLLAVAAVALVDVPLQRHQLLQRLKMSHQEVKKEMKDAEGNVEVKAKIKARMRQMANRRMLAAVPGADLVVMNPTHFAVALKYDDTSMAAPRVVAKGADLLAFKIRDLAREHKVPVLQLPPLARALYAHTEVDQEIPAALFSAVAQVLAWVYQLRTAVGRGSADLPPPEVRIPPELDPANKKPPGPAADDGSDA